MNLYKISHGIQEISHANHRALLANRLVSVHPGGQRAIFRNLAPGDVFYLCRSNQTIELIGMCTDARSRLSPFSGFDEWEFRSFEILFEAVSPQNYNRDLNKAWTPRGVSACAEVPENQYAELETAILQPAFGITRAHVQAARAQALENIAMDNYINTLRHKKQIILQGPPGTGKTYTAKKIAERMTGEQGGEQGGEQVKIIQFHPSYAYEDFVRGITAKSEGGEIVYETENKLLASFAEKAKRNLDASKKDVAELSREQEVEELLLQFAEKVQDEIDEHKAYAITEAVSIHAVEEDAFRYTGDWKTSQRMKFKDLVLAQINGVSSRQALKKLAGVSGLAKQHASYFFKVLRKFQEMYQSELKKTSHPKVERPEVKPYVLIIDEINRANLPSVLGELIYALEYRDEAVESMYALDGDNAITIPKNLYIIGTMNTADRSVGHIDYAIKRRFAFVDVLPNEEVIKNEKAKALFQQVAALFVKKENEVLVNSDFLASDFDYKDVQLGHSYFLVEDQHEELSLEEQHQKLQLQLRYEILPILHEYVKDGLLLETAQVEINKIAKFDC